MGGRVIRCKHFRELKECLPCYYGSAVLKELPVSLGLTEHEKKKGLNAVKLLLKVRNRCRELAKPETTTRALMMRFCETRIEYDDLVLAWRVAFKAQRVSARTAEDMARTLIVRLLAGVPTPPSPTKAPTHPDPSSAVVIRGAKSDGSAVPMRGYKLDEYTARMPHHVECNCKRCSGKVAHPPQCFCKDFKRCAKAVVAA